MLRFNSRNNPQNRFCLCSILLKTTYSQTQRPFCF